MRSLLVEVAARTSKVRSPVTVQSGWMPTGSLLCTPMMWQVKALQSVARTVNVTGTKRFGDDEIFFGSALRSSILGALVSSTVTLVEHWTTAALPSQTRTPIVWAPKLRSALSFTLRGAAGCTSPSRLVCTSTPSTDHTMASASPSGSLTVAFNSVPHSMVMFVGQMTVGGWFSKAPMSQLGPEGRGKLR